MRGEWWGGNWNNLGPLPLNSLPFWKACFFHFAILLIGIFYINFHWYFCVYLPFPEKHFQIKWEPHHFWCRNYQGLSTLYLLSREEIVGNALEQWLSLHKMIREQICLFDCWHIRVFRDYCFIVLFLSQVTKSDLNTCNTRIYSESVYTRLFYFLDPGIASIEPEIMNHNVL